MNQPAASSQAMGRAQPHGSYLKREVYRITPGSTHRFFVLCHRVWSFDTHFIDNRTQVCLESLGGCAINHHTNPPHFQGWLCCQAKSSKAIVMVSLTPGAASALDLHRMEGKSLRGLELEVWRERNDITSPMRALLQISFVPRLDVPVGLDVPAFLERLWRLPAGSIPRDEPGEDIVNLASIEGPKLSQEQRREVKRLAGELKKGVAR